MLYSDSSGESFKPEQFWGFRYPLGRSYWEIDQCDWIEFRTGILATIHKKLTYSRREVETIKDQIKTIYQSQGLKLKLQLLDDEISAEGLCIDKIIKLFQEDLPYGIIHFACHCLNDNYDAAGNSFLSLTIHNSDLKLTINILELNEDEGFKDQPFIFLNACDSSTSGHPLQTSSFPSSLLGFGAGGVIATNCLIPDIFASAFAREFYRRLLERLADNSPVKVAEILVETRLHFWTKYHNPLGLAYGLYSVSDQKLVIS